MPSHSVARLFSVSEVDEGKRRARFALRCGCVVEREVLASRFIDLGDELRLGGKYPCPSGHAVGETAAID